MLTRFSAGLALASPAVACGGPDDPSNYHLAIPEGPPKGNVMHLNGGSGRGKGQLKSGLTREAAERG